MKDFDKELDLDQLDEVNGGTQPSYPAGFKTGAVMRSRAVLENMQQSMTANSDIKNPAGTVNKCPQCGADLRFDPEAKSSYCTGCGYTPAVNV